ncbi:hypothetical protein [Mameliella alba]|uniref:VpaChn25_0724 family phage protein n=1 Tax=Mameliella alba TaxID=561184 RepID=UPI000B533FEA|nr:hypothetical protein [Mameliella alba]OWV43200.1 hypothetical protein CDZ95_10435 [Mameliella alba]BBU57406.1 hypothetical protein KU6B_36710 [Mameliella alba]
MNEYAEKHVYPVARIMMLQLMDAAPEGETNARMLTALLQGSSAVLWFDQVVEQLKWLEKAGLCTVSEKSEIILAKVTRSGSLVAQGLKRVPGVDRPRGDV